MIKEFPVCQGRKSLIVNVWIAIKKNIQPLEILRRVFEQQLNVFRLYSQLSAQHIFLERIPLIFKHQQILCLSHEYSNKFGFCVQRLYETNAKYALVMQVHRHQLHPVVLRVDDAAQLVIENHQVLHVVRVSGGAT